MSIIHVPGHYLKHFDSNCIQISTTRSEEDNNFQRLHE
jgi:hypothetical protein